MVTLSADDLGLQIDYGRNEPGDVLQRWDGEGWRTTGRMESWLKTSLILKLYRLGGIGCGQNKKPQPLLTGVSLQGCRRNRLISQKQTVRCKVGGISRGIIHEEK